MKKPLSSTNSCLAMVGIFLGLAVIGSLIPSTKASPTNPQVKAEQTCQPQEISRVCTGCNIAAVETRLADCTITSQAVSDDTCTERCAVSSSSSSSSVSSSVSSTTTKSSSSASSAKSVAPAPKPKPAPAPTFTCNCSKTCAQMISCAEAYFQLNQCGCTKRDGDHDGIPCEDIC